MILISIEIRAGYGGPLTCSNVAHVLVEKRELLDIDTLLPSNQEFLCSDRNSYVSR